MSGCGTVLRSTVDLLVDPAHLVCVCFHRSGTWPVERYIGWERIR
jgi:hypothetical protein